MDSTDVEGSVLTEEGTDTAHVVTVVSVLVAAETVHVGVEDVGYYGKTVEVFAILAVWAEASSKEETEVGTGDGVSSGVA